MSDPLAKLLTLDPNSIEWEAERCRIIGGAIAEAPEEHRSKLMVLQRKLDEKRESCSGEEFIGFISHLMSELADNLEDVVGFARVKLGIEKK